MTEYGLNTQCVWKMTPEGMAFAKHRMDSPDAPSQTVFARIQPVFEWKGQGDLEGVPDQVSFCL